MSLSPREQHIDTFIRGFDVTMFTRAGIQLQLLNYIRDKHLNSTDGVNLIQDFIAFMRDEKK